MASASAHPAFAPYARWPLGAAPPSLATLNAWAHAASLALPDGRALRFADVPVASALDYEAAVARDAVIPTRADNLHDACNALAWLAFPRAKAVLNAVHVRAGAAATANRRDRARDAATLLDESGLLLACADEALVALLRAHRWRELFVTHARDVARAMRPLALGHGLLAKLARPYRAITAHVLVLPVPAADATVAAIDVAAAAAIALPALAPARLAVLPVAALPGWDREALGAALFDDVSVFRPARTAG
ncbi:MAG: DUF3025 domain-containing protein [Burkholderiales bacterium]